jgi:hypothetical protein
VATTDDDVLDALREAGASLARTHQGWVATVDWDPRAGVLAVVAGCDRWQVQGGQLAASNRSRAYGTWVLPSGARLELALQLTQLIVASCVVAAGLANADGERDWFVKLARGNVEGGRPQHWIELIDLAAGDLLDDADFGQEFPASVTGQATAARLLLDEMQGPQAYAPELYADVTFLVDDLVRTLVSCPELLVTAQALDRDPVRTVPAPLPRAEGSRGW